MNEQILALAVIARDEATATLARIDQSLDRLGAQANIAGGKFASLNSTMKNIAGGLALGVAIGAVTGFFGEATQAAIEEEAGIRRLDASLKANVAGWDGNTGAIEQTIRQREGLAFSDDELRASLGRLVATTHDTSGAFALQATAMDLARFKNISLSDATDALVKVNAGSFRVLKSLGIEVDANTTSTEALARVQAIAAGQAAAFGSTSEGAMQAAGIAMHNLQEDIGRTFLPIVGKAAEAMTGLLRGTSAKADLTKQTDAVGVALNRIFSGDIGGLARLPEETEKAVVAAQRETAALNYQATAAYLAFERATALTKASGEQARAQLAATVAAGRSADATEDEKKAAADAADEFKQLTTVFDGYNHVTVTSARASDEFGFANRAAMDKAVAGMTSAYKTANDLHDAINDIPRAIDISLAYRVATAPFFNPRAAAGTADADRKQAFSSGGDEEALKAHSAATAAAFAARQDAANKAAEAAKAAASAAAQASADAAREAFSAAKEYGDRYFDDIHDKNKKAIQDAHDRATAEITAERKAVDDRLAERKRLNAAPVTAAEQALASAEHAHRRRDLDESLAAAQAGGDAKAIRSAQEALLDFMAQDNIDKLRATAAAADAAAEGDAAKAKAGLDTRQGKVDTTLAAQLAAEDKRAAARKKAYDDELAAEVKHLANVKGAHARAIAEIEALYSKFHIGQKGKPGEGDGLVVHTHVHLDGKQVAESVDRHQFNSSRIHQPSVPGQGY